MSEFKRAVESGLRRADELENLIDVLRDKIEECGFSQELMLLVTEGAITTEAPLVIELDRVSIRQDFGLSENTLEPPYSLRTHSRRTFEFTGRER